MVLLNLLVEASTIEGDSTPDPGGNLYSSFHASKHCSAASLTCGSGLSCLMQIYTQF